MSLNTAQLEFLAARGLTLSEAIELSRLGDVRKDATAAERKRRQREREKDRAGEQDEPIERDMSQRDVTRDTPFPAPAPSFPPNPLTNPTPTHTHDGNNTRARKADPFDCPDGVDPVDWEALKANRKAKRAALSEGAHRQIVNKLQRWARAGWPPGPIVAMAAERGWTTVFETDEMKNGTGRQNERGQHPTDSLVSAVARRQAERAAGRLHEPGDGPGHWA